MCVVVRVSVFWLERSDTRSLSRDGGERGSSGSFGLRSVLILFFFSSRRRHTRFDCDWSSDVCSSDLFLIPTLTIGGALTYGNGGVAAARLIVPLLASAAMSSLLLMRLNQLASVTHRRDRKSVV